MLGGFFGQTTLTMWSGVISNRVDVACRSRKVIDKGKRVDNGTFWKTTIYKVWIEAVAACHCSNIAARRETR